VSEAIKAVEEVCRQLGDASLHDLHENYVIYTDDIRELLSLLNAKTAEIDRLREALRECVEYLEGEYEHSLHGWDFCVRMREVLEMATKD
tara:strand:- start:180 stop:449 length:270 start_codon:yes stop_codon:yes gene_type:complete